MPLIERFWDKADQSGGPDACWPWLAGKSGVGYGRISESRRGRNRLAHRVAYELTIGPIPDGLEIDHLCRNVSCVNPAHMEPVTSRENVLRGDTITAAHARQTHCKRGHPFDEVNTERWGPDNRWRFCRECRQLAQTGKPRQVPFRRRHRITAPKE